MQSFQIFGVGLLAAISAMIVKQLRADMVLPLRLTGTVILLGAALATGVPIYSYIEQMISDSKLSEFASILIKALGIALMTHICAEICRDCGEASVASCVELAGKCEILLLSLPLVSSLLDTAADILGHST